MIPWICGTLYAASDEWHQTFVEGRSGEIRDVILDSIGVAAGIVGAHLIRSIWESAAVQKAVQKGDRQSREE